MKKILVVDDINLNIEAVRNILHIYLPEYEVITAQSGKEGIRLAKEFSPEAILLDYLMPVMDGFEVCKILKEDESTRTIPVLMVSALGDNSKVRTEGLNAGADAFISKPFDIREFIALVNVMLRIKSAEDMLRKHNEDLELHLKRQTRNYEDSEERFLQISKHALEFFWETDAQGVFTFVSESAEWILAYNSSEIIGDYHLYDFADDEDPGNSRSVIIDKLEKVESFDDAEFSFIRRDGKHVWLTVNAFPVLDDNKQLLGYRGVCDDNTRRKKAEDNLKKSLKEIQAYQQRLKNLNKELTLTEEKERKRIAEYLHDGIGQTLALAFINLSSVVNQDLPVETKNLIKNASDLINSAILESRLLTYDLSPPVLYEFGLMAAIKWKLDQTTDKFKIETRLVENVLFLKFENDTTILIYRILCELITNAIKHAQAGFIEVEVNKTETAYCFIVRDDGAGFEQSIGEEPEDSGSFGLFSINERLDSMNGYLEIDSRKGEGTVVKVSIPG